MTKTAKHLRAMVDTYEAIQKERISAENRLRAMFQGVDETDPLRQSFFEKLTQLQNLEKAIARDIDKLLKREPVYTEFLHHVKGIGALLSARLIALELDPHKNISSWWAYFGLTPNYYLVECENGDKFMSPKVPAQCKYCQAKIKNAEFVNEAPRRKKGYKSFWNPHARKLVYLISTSFIKLGKYYREVYKTKKEAILKSDPNIQPIRADARARRYTVKLFLSHYYQATCELNGIPYTLPYSIEILKHDSLIHWKEVVAREKA